MSDIDKLNFIKLKCFVSNDTVKKVKRQTLDKAEIFANVYLIRYLYRKIDEELLTTLYNRDS